MRSTCVVINRGQQYVVFSATLKNYTADNDFSNDQLFQELYPLCTSGTNKGRLASQIEITSGKKLPLKNLKQILLYQKCGYHAKYDI